MYAAPAGLAVRAWPQPAAAGRCPTCRSKQALISSMAAMAGAKHDGGLTQCPCPYLPPLVAANIGVVVCACEIANKQKHRFDDVGP